MKAPHGEYAFSKHLNAWLSDLRRPAPRGLAKWTPAFLIHDAALWSVLATLATLTPKTLICATAPSPSATCAHGGSAGGSPTRRGPNTTAV
jgi:hypothetical protein